MTAIDSPPRRSGLVRRTFLVWAAALAFIILYQTLEPILDRFGLDNALFGLFSFLSWLLVIAISLFWIAVAIRWTLRRLFWRVGRRLFLSYVMIGVLPFFLMAVLLLAVAYMIAGVMSHAALRGERQAMLGQMESWALEYGLTGQRPADPLPSLEIYDTAEGDQGIPRWLQRTTFSGMVRREREPLLVTSRSFGTEDEPRAVVFVQPLDENWSRQLEEKAGMIVVYDDDHTRTHTRSGAGNTELEIDPDTDRAFERILQLGWAIDRVIWRDITALTDWDTGADQRRHLGTFISTPYSSLFQFYFGTGSGTYMLILRNIIITICVMLMMFYMFAAFFAAVLIYSISRAVNRIEKGTKAVERGDFSYRIRMKPHNQLGEMAQSFDRMTESIASLLTNVAEKERLQSEIAIAATIQRNLLPQEGPHHRGVSFSAHFEPTTSIGGDYYDVFPLDEGRLAVAIGDVSGHGLSTGLVMAMVKAAITTLVQSGADEDTLFHRLNELVHRSTERRVFMTLAFSIFDLPYGRIRHTNAGHLYPYLLREGESTPRAIECPSLPLGVRSAIAAHTVEVELQEGDAVVYLSDGIIEAQNRTGDPFGFERLEQLLGHQADRSPAAIRDAILADLAQHCGERPSEDDRTVMVLRFDHVGAAAREAEFAESASA